MSKKIPSEMEKEEKVFLNGTKKGGVHIVGALANGVSEAAARKVFREMSAFAEYAFNKSHAAAYAFLAYQTAYLKRYYPVEFITAVLNNRIGSTKDIQNYLNYLKTRGIAILSPDINKSSSGFTVENNSVRIGLTALKSIGEGIIEEIIAERKKNGDFIDFYSFLDRMQHSKINKRQLESMIVSGVFDYLGIKRKQLVEVVSAVIEKIAGARESRARGQFDMFETLDVSDEPIKYPNIDEYDLSEKLKFEKEVTGIYISGHPLDEYTDFLNSFEINTGMVGADDAGSNLKDEKLILGGMLVAAERRLTKKGAEMGFGRLEDLHGSIELMVPPVSFERLKSVWVSDTIVTVRGRLNDDEEAKLWVESLMPLMQGRGGEKRPATLIIKLPRNEWRNPDLYRQITDLVKAYPGNNNLIFKNTDDNQERPYGQGISLSGAFEAQLYGLVALTAVEIRD